MKGVGLGCRVEDARCMIWGWGVPGFGVQGVGFQS